MLSLLPERAPDATLPAAAAAALATPSRPLPSAQRQRFEASLGLDLSPLRVHDGAAASQAARLLGARAFTVGRDVVIGSGASGNVGAGNVESLLAHELVHVAQQNQVGRVTPSMDAGHGAPLEHEAITLGQRLQRAEPVSLARAASAPAVQRAIAPEDVAGEMVGRSFELAKAFSSGSVSLRKGDRVTVVSWTNSAPDVLVSVAAPAAGAAAPVHVNVPKALLRPVSSGVATVNPYSAGVPQQAAAVEKGDAKLSAWMAKRSEYKTPKATAVWDKEKVRLEGLLATRRKLLNRKLIQETMFNRFDSIIESEVAAANSTAGLSGKGSLDPNLVKSMLFQESQLGTSGAHLEVPPSHPVKSRFNLGQVIDSSAMALLTLMEREHPTLITSFALGSLRADLSAAQVEKAGLVKKQASGPLDATEAARLVELEGLSAQSWEAFIWAYGHPTGFARAVDDLFGATTPARNLDYQFWIHMAVLWLFEKKRAGMSWLDTIRAYNGSGARARHYRDAVSKRATDAADAAAAGIPFVPGGI